VDALSGLDTKRNYASRVPLYPHDEEGRKDKAITYIGPIVRILIGGNAIERGLPRVLK
jgi:hypothetical protein